MRRVFLNQNLRLIAFFIINLNRNLNINLSIIIFAIVNYKKNVKSPRLPDYKIMFMLYK